MVIVRQAVLLALGSSLPRPSQDVSSQWRSTVSTLILCILAVDFSPFSLQDQVDTVLWVRSPITVAGPRWFCTNLSIKPSQGHLPRYVVKKKQMEPPIAREAPLYVAYLFSISNPGQ